MLTSVILGLVGQIVGLFGEKGKANQEAITKRIENMSRSWFDDLLVLYWFAPTVLMFFDLNKGTQIASVMTENRELYDVQIAITMAIFGIARIKKSKS